MRWVEVREGKKNTFERAMIKGRRGVRRGVHKRQTALYACRVERHP
jgi:hypothetical protein